MLRKFASIVNQAFWSRTSMNPRRVAFASMFMIAGLPAQASTPESVPVRHIPFVLVTDQFFRELPNWRGLAQSALAMASEDLEKEAGLRFDLAGEGTWEVPDSAQTMAAALKSATTAFPNHPGILAVLLGPRDENDIPGAELGYAFLGRPAFLVVAANGSGHEEKRDLAMLMRHELGHVFGIPHLAGRTIMNPVPDARAWEFGELGMDVLHANRGMTFASEDPFAGCDLGMLRDVYAVLDERGLMEPFLWIELGRSFEMAGQIDASETAYESGLRHDRTSIAARFGIARCAESRQDTTKVLVLAHALSRMQLTSVQLSDLGALWLRLNDFTAAESTLAHAVARHPAPEAWFNLGLARLRLKDQRGASVAFQQYLELDPKGGRREEAKRYLAETTPH
jgi:tetratricopeptide (TPR) repeat protein